MIEKMKFISVIGPKDQLDTVTRQYLCRYEIQLENAMGELKHLNNITPNAELNPYREAAGRAAEIAALYGSKATAVRDMDVDTAMERITEVQSRIQKADRETDALEKELKKERGLLDAVSPYQELHFDISRILHFKEVRFRFGRLPVGYYERLKTYAYDDACTIFEKCKETEDYVWGVYFVPAAEAKKVDAIYASLHFERIHLEDAYEGTVDEACRELKEKTDALEQQITAVRAELAKELNGMSESISAASKTLAYESKLFDVRKLAAFTKAKNETFFILCGWMENKEADLLKKELETAGMVERLALMERQYVDWGTDSISIHEEIQFVEAYLELQKYRFGNRLSYQIEVDDSCRGYCVPKLTLVTFAENACVHGLENKTAAGWIFVRCYCDEGVLCMEVEDTCHGMSPDLVRDMQENMNNASMQLLKENRRVGIMNACLRLRMATGNQACFELESEKGSGTIITIKIPVEALHKKAWKQNENL